MHGDELRGGGGGGWGGEAGGSWHLQIARGASVAVARLEVEREDAGPKESEEGGRDSKVPCAIGIGDSQGGLAPPPMAKWKKLMKHEESRAEAFGGLLLWPAALVFGVVRSPPGHLFPRTAASFAFLFFPLFFFRVSLLSMMGCRRAPPSLQTLEAAVSHSKPQTFSPPLPTHTRFSRGDILFCLYACKHVACIHLHMHIFMCHCCLFLTIHTHARIHAHTLSLTHTCREWCMLEIL